MPLIADRTTEDTTLLGENRSEDAPAISVIFAVPGSARSISATMRHLREQTVREQMEIVLVAESVESLALMPEMVEGFGSYKVIEIGKIESIASAYARGIRLASSAVVAFAEDHSFPAPGWAAALINAHRASWAAVGPLMLNANPETAVSWADFLMGYGPWIHPARCGERDHLPGHNSSYKREILLRYGQELESLLEAETVLQWRLRQDGHRLCQSVAAQTRHTNFALVRSFAAACFYNGQAFAAARASQWFFPRRLLFTLASPLIPAVRFWRINRDLQLPELRQNELRRALPAVFLGLALDGLGQMLGYALGRGGSRKKLRELEFDRASHVTAADRERLFGEEVIEVPEPVLA